MKKPVVATTRPLSAVPAGPLWQAQPIFNYRGLGRQANPAIQASLLPAQTVSAADARAAAEAAAALHTAADATASLLARVAEDPTMTVTTREEERIIASTLPAVGVQAMAGFESVTLLLQGDLDVQTALPVQHGITASAGDVVWNGAGAGVLTRTLPGPVLREQGGTIEAVSLWINLPASGKLSDPHLQHLKAADMPTIVLPDSAGTLRVIAGEWKGELGPAETVQPLQLWDVHVKAGHTVTLPLPRKWYAQLVMLTGKIHIDFWPGYIRSPELILLDALGDGTTCTTQEDTHLLVLCAETLNETIAGTDALVFADQAHLQDAQARLEAGGFGTLD